MVSLDLSALSMAPGEGRRITLEIPVGAVTLSGADYVPQQNPTSVRLDISRLAGGGYAFGLELDVAVGGPCVRCLKEAVAVCAVRAREVDVPGGGEDMRSPYVAGDILDVAGWAREAVVLSLPDKILCREDCPGLCPVCAADLAEVGPDHTHQRDPDPRWAALRGVFEEPNGP